MPEKSSASDELARAWGRDALRTIVAALERAGSGGRAFFDWDNTVIRGDVGDLVMLEVLASAPLARPTERGAWGPLTARAEARLEDVFGGAERLDVDDPRRALAAQVVADVVWREELDGEPAFAVPRTRAWRGGYFAMAAIVEALPSSLRIELATRAFESALGRAPGDALPVGSPDRAGARYSVERFARPRAAMRALHALAREGGLETWVVSASQEDAVRTVAARLGFAPERVIGARPSWSAAAFPSLEGAPVMTFDEGKRAAIAHLVEGVPPHEALAHRPRVAVACGDSDTDHAMLEDADALVVLVDRGQPRVGSLARRREAEGRVSVLRAPHERW
jgi:phosphoserine phosphatase